MDLTLGARDAIAASVLDAWLGAGPYDGPWAVAQQARWFRRDALFDAELARRFGELPDQAASGALDGWLGHPPDWLAFLIVVDQLPRNLHRDSARAFALDPLAQRVALRGQAQGFDQALPAAVRLFCYLPFEHAEDAELQSRSLAAFEALHAVADAELRAATVGWLDYARRHAEPIGLFGRFPHRNDVLGRISSKAEQQFLAEHPDGF